MVSVRSLEPTGFGLVLSLSSRLAVDKGLTVGLDQDFSQLLLSYQLLLRTIEVLGLSLRGINIQCLLGAIG